MTNSPTTFTLVVAEGGWEHQTALGNAPPGWRLSLTKLPKLGEVEHQREHRSR